MKQARDLAEPEGDSYRPSKCSVGFVLIGKILRPHIFAELFHRTFYLLFEIEVSAQEPRAEIGGDAEHVVQYQYLAVTVATGADADGWDLDRFGDLLGQT